MIIKQNVEAEEFNRLANSYQYEIDGLQSLAESECDEDLRKKILDSMRMAKSCLENLLHWASTSEYDVDIDEYKIYRVKVRMTDLELYYSGVYGHSIDLLEAEGYIENYAERVLDKYIEWRRKQEKRKHNIVEKWIEYSRVHVKPVKKRFAEEIGENYSFVCEVIRDSQREV